MVEKVTTRAARCCGNQNFKGKDFMETGLRLKGYLEKVKDGEKYHDRRTRYTEDITVW